MTTVYFILLGMFACTAVVLACVAIRMHQTPVKPVITVAWSRLQAGWYQIDITVVTADPGRYIEAKLRRARPRSARLLAPVSTVKTKEGAFQVWADPSRHKPATEISLDISVELRETGESVTATAYTASLTAWLFLPEESAIGRAILELVLLDCEKRAHRYRLPITRQKPA